MAEKKSIGESKSTRKVVKKAEEPKAVRDDKQEAEQVKPLSINWDIVGSSSGFTLILTAAIFLIGWAYEANWYGFFGISMSQIDTPIQQIFIYGFPVVFRVFVILSLMVLFAFIMKVNRKSNSWILTDVNWLWIFGFLNILILIMMQSLIYSAFGQSLYFNDEFTGTLPAEISGSAVGGGIFMLVSAVMAFYLLVIEVESRPIKSNWTKRLLRILGTKDINKSVFQNVSKRGWLALMVLTFYVEVLGLSASIAIENAATGKRSVGGYVQEVHLVSPQQLNSLDKFEISCYQSNCVYGSFGLIAENDRSFYMIAWSKEKIPYHPGLFIFPRNDQNEPYVILPVSVVGDVTPTPTTTSVVLPTSTTTKAPTLKSKITSTSTPIPNQP